ncbi:MAG: transposase, partial [Firmicutes bacterium]|nr:transposase [Bacillota bacterium]
MNFFDELERFMEEHKADFWAEQEFSGALVGDARRTARLIMIAAAKAKNPEAAMSLCMNKNDSQSICRFFARPEVTLDSVL